MDFSEEKNYAFKLKNTHYFLVSDCVKRKSVNNVNSIFRGEENFLGRIQGKTHSPPPSVVVHTPDKFSCILIVKSL